MNGRKIKDFRAWARKEASTGPQHNRQYRDKAGVIRWRSRGYRATIQRLKSEAKEPPAKAVPQPKGWRRRMRNYRLPKLLLNARHWLTLDAKQHLKWGPTPRRNP